MNSGANGEGFAALVRDADPTRYFANLFAPAAMRNDLFVLYALDLEIRKIAQTIREPMAGEIRLQWWREVFDGQRDDEANANPIASAALAMSRKHQVDPSIWERYFDGRIFDFYSDPIEDQAAFEAYCGQTDGTVLQISCLILDRDQSTKAAELSGYLACVSSIWNRIIKPMSVSTDKHLFRYLPPEVRANMGSDANPYLDNTVQDNSAALLETLEFLEPYLEKARAISHNVPSALRPAFLHASQISRALGYLRKEGRIDPQMMDVSTYRLIWRLWRSSKKWPCF